MKVHWTDTAERHLDAIYAYISRDSLIYAKRTIDKLTRTSQRIAEFPMSGRKVPEYDSEHIREIIEGPYRIMYYIKEGQVDVLAVIHTAQDISH